MYVKFLRQAILVQDTIFFMLPAQQEFGSEGHKNNVYESRNVGLFNVSNHH
jgi:hypothetical protein